MSVDSSDIKQALANKHVTEFFVLEVKNGSTVFSSHLLMIDAIAIYKSWSHQRIVAYEIKVSRSDYQRDAKYTAYTAYCNELYLICPTGMIRPEEVPLEIGLMWYNPATKNITTKRKARFINQKPDADMLYYLLMYRLDGDRYPFHSSKADFFKEWLANRDYNRQFGLMVQGELPKEIRRLNDELDKVKHLSGQHDLLRKIKKTIEDHGIACWDINDIPKAIDKMASKPYSKELDDIEKHADIIRGYVQEAREKQVRDSATTSTDATREGDAE